MAKKKLGKVVKFRVFKNDAERDQYFKKHPIDFSRHSLAEVWDLLMNEVPVTVYNPLADQACAELEARISAISKRSWEL